MHDRARQFTLTVLPYPLQANHESIVLFALRAMRRPRLGRHVFHLGDIHCRDLHGSRRLRLHVWRNPDADLQAEFGWAHGGAAAIDEATLWVVPNGSIIEAWLWPPIEQAGLVPTQSTAHAAGLLRRGLAPVAVLGTQPETALPGVAVLRHSEVVSVLSHAANGRLFLAPVYRFEGVVRLAAQHARHHWYSLIPAMRR